MRSRKLEEGKILLVDVGNTCVTVARVEGGSVGKLTVLPIEGEYLEPLEALVGVGSVIVMASVNPRVSDVIEARLGRVCSVVLFGRDFGAGIPVLLDEPEEAGADRLLNGVAAFRRFGASVVVDFGTATTFDVVSPKGEYLGGAIAPGIRISLKALGLWTALLPEVKPRGSPPLLGKNTEEAVLSGVVYGTAAMVDGMLRRFGAELPFQFKVVGTGGAANLVLPLCETEIEHIAELTLEGLYLAYRSSVDGESE